MKLSYGAKGVYMDVTSKMDKSIDLRGVKYNDIFGDPVYGVTKELLVDDDVSGRLHVKEDIHFQMDTGGICPPVHLVYVSDGTTLPDIDIDADYVRIFSPQEIDSPYEVFVVKENVHFHALSYIYEKRNEDCIVMYMEGGDKEICMANLIKYRNIFSLYTSVSRIVPEIYDDGSLPYRVWWVRSTYISRLIPPSINDNHQWVQQIGSFVGCDTYVYRSNCLPSPGLGILSTSSGERYIRLDINGPVHHGLTNQILTLCAGIFIAAKSGRRLIVTGFYPDYNLKTTVHIGELVDLEKYNEYLSTIGTHLSDIRDTPVRPWMDMDSHTHRYKASQASDRIGPYPYIHIPNIALDFDKFTQVPWDEDLPMYMEIRRRFPFAKDLVDRVSHVRNCVSIHLRLEDDMITHLIR